MKLAEVQSRCECQARLFAEIDGSGRVLSGWSTTRSFGGENQPRELTPATGMGVGAAQFQVGWLCPECGRNTVRSFFLGALVFREVETAAAASGT